MSSTARVIVALAVLVVIVVVVAIAARGRRARQVEGQRDKARELREQAGADRIEVQRREADAAKVDAQARMAQAEADAKAADAAALQAEAVQRGEHASGSREEVEERLRQADRIDPDVPGDDTTDGRNARS